MSGRFMSGRFMSRRYLHWYSLNTSRSHSTLSLVLTVKVGGNGRPLAPALGPDIAYRQTESSTDLDNYLFNTFGPRSM